MKRSHLAMFIAITVLLFTASCFAQEQRGPGGRGGRQMPSVDDQTKDLTAALKLSDDQSKQVHAILQDQQDQRIKLMQDQSMSREEKMPKMRDIHESAAAKIRALLNDDQKKKFDDMEKERQERWQHRKDQQPQGDSTSPQ